MVCFLLMALILTQNPNPLPPDATSLGVELEKFYRDSEAKTDEERRLLVEQYAAPLLESVGGDCSKLAPQVIQYMRDVMLGEKENVEKQSDVFMCSQLLLAYFPCTTEKKIKGISTVLLSEDKVQQTAAMRALTFYCAPEEMFMKSNDGFLSPDFSAFVPFLSQNADSDPAAQQLAQWMIGLDSVQALNILAGAWAANPQERSELEELTGQLSWMNERHTMEQIRAGNSVVDKLLVRPEWWARLAVVHFLTAILDWRSDERFDALKADDNDIVRQSAERLKESIDFPMLPYVSGTPEEQKEQYRSYLEKGFVTIEQLRHHGVDIDEVVTKDSQPQSASE